MRIVETSDGQYRIDHTRDRHNDQAIAFTLGVDYLLNKRRRGNVELIV